MKKQKLSSSEEDTVRDWTNLPPELIEKIVETLTNLPDYIRFRAVCTTWRSSSGPPSRQFLPWLLISVTPTHYRFLNPSENWKPYFIPIPSSSKIPRSVFGSGNGFLIRGGHKNFYLVNPLLPLTSFHTIPPWITYSSMAPSKFVQSSKVSICGTVGNNFLWRLGDPSWTSYEDYIKDFTIYRGRLYVYMTRSKETNVLDPSNFTRICKIQPPDGVYDTDKPDGCHELMVQEPSIEDLLEDLLLVVRSHPKFFVFKLDLSQQPPKWLEVESIGNNALFFGITNCYCFPANKYNGLKGNCIYSMSSIDLSINRYQLCVHNIVDGSVEQLQEFNSTYPVWFAPSLS